MRKLALLVAIAAGVAGCTTETAKGPVPDLSASRKADGPLEIVRHDDFAWGQDLAAELRPGVAHAWTFELSDSAELAFETGGDVDTVLYVHDSDDVELDVDDDGGEYLLSSLSIALDAGSYRVTVGGYANAQEGPFTLRASCEGEGCGDGGEGDATEPPAGDPWGLARDVHRMNAAFTDATPIPERGEHADAPSPLWLAGPEWWQRWSGGVTQDFSWDNGSDYGKRCAVAASIRLRAIWDYEEEGEGGEAHRPGREAFEALLDGSGWGGSMYNWIEDVSGGGYPSFDPASLWAWRTGTVKWITVVRPDGSCDLPTLEMVQEFSARCLEQAAGDDGEIEGCRVSGG